MYKSSYFEEKDADKILAFMRAHSFVTLMGFDGDYPVATQVPVQIVSDEKGMRLIGHVMKKTDHEQAFARNNKVLVLFTGAHAYISAAVYKDPAVASTWNYSSVQVKGKLTFLTSAQTREVIQQLTNAYEDPSTSAAAFHQMDDAYIDRHLKAISGFEIFVEELNTVFKLSQNHTEANRKNIIADLKQSTDPNSLAVAHQMEEGL